MVTKARGKAPANKVRGEVSAEFGGVEFVFVASLAALAEVESETGVPFPKIAEGMGDGVSVATLLACAKAFARAGGADDVSPIENSSNLTQLAVSVGACISAAFKSDKTAKN